MLNKDDAIVNAIVKYIHLLLKCYFVCLRSGFSLGLFQRVLYPLGGLMCPSGGLLCPSGGLRVVYCALQVV